MKPLFLACLLLVAGPVYAEQTSIDFSGAQRVNLSYGPTEEELGQAIVYAASQSTSCLARMEKAMRDAEWFLTKPLIRDGSYIVPDVDYPGMNTEIHNKAQAMWLYWNDTKKDCWTKP